MFQKKHKNLGIMTKCKARTHIYFMTWNLTKEGSFVHNPNLQNHVSSNLGKILVGIEHKMFRSTTHPKPIIILEDDNE